MRIALLDPVREAGDLAATLEARGDDVILVPGWGPPPLSVQRYYEDHLELVPSVVWRLARGRFDLAHAFAPAFGWAAARARRLGGPPFVYSLRGPLTRRWLVDRHYRLEMMRATAAAAREVLVDDEETAIAVRRYLLREARISLRAWC